MKVALLEGLLGSPWCLGRLSSQLWQIWGTGTGSAETAPWTSPTMTELSPPLFNTGLPFAWPYCQTRWGAVGTATCWAWKLGVATKAGSPWFPLLCVFMRPEIRSLSCSSFHCGRRALFHPRITQIPTADGEGHGNPLPVFFPRESMLTEESWATVYRIAC